MLHDPCCSGELRDIVSVSKYDVDVEVGSIPKIYIYVSHVCLNCCQCYSLAAKDMRVLYSLLYPAWPTEVRGAGRRKGGTLTRRRGGWRGFKRGR